MDSLNLQNIASAYKYLLFTSTFLLLFFSMKSNMYYCEDLPEGKINFNNLFTEQAIFAFFFGFGGIGFVLSRFLKNNAWLTFIIACFVGLAVMYCYCFLISKFQNKNRKKESELIKFVNKEGKNKKFLYPYSEGQIELLIDEQVVFQKIVNNSGEEIKEDEQIRIVRFEKGNLFVEKI